MAAAAQKSNTSALDPLSLLDENSDAYQACKLLAGHWPTYRQRHQVVQYLAGGMLRNDWPESDVTRFVEMAAFLANDKCHGRYKTDVRALAKREDRYQLPGFASLAKVISPEVVGTVRELLGIYGQEPMLRVVCLNCVENKLVRWLWDKRVAFEKLNELCGDPGRGKTFIALDVAARYTTGRAMPGEEEARLEPGNVLIASDEDDADDTIRPRMEALGADMDRVSVLDEIVCEEEGRPLSLPGDLKYLREAIEELKIGLVILDPFSAFFDDGIDSNKDASVRRLMHALKKLARETGVAILLIRHLNKSATVTNPLYRAGGSIAFTAAVRSGLIVDKHPDNDGECVLASTKHNLSAEPDSLAYKIEADLHGKVRIHWQGAVDFSAVDLLAKAGDKGEKAARQVKRAGTKILDALDRIDPDRKGALRNKIQKLARVSGRDWTCAVQDLLEQGVVEQVEVEVTVGNGAKRKFEGLKRKKP